MGIIRRKREKSGRRPVRQVRKEKMRRSKKALGNEVIAKYWNEDETVEQNYRRLGLTTKFTQTGGQENDLTKEAIPTRHIIKSLPQQGRIVHHSDGRTEIVYEKVDIDADVVPEAPKTKAVAELEAFARKPAKKIHPLSREDRDLAAALVAKHGDDYTAMQWDKRLNPFQHGAGKLKKLIKKWQETA